ncbi:hypothetical protein [Paenibacillus borealis]|nr:hypothetical protein [Paenibacillus borealis]
MKYKNSPRKLPEEGVNAAFCTTILVYRQNHEENVVFCARF